MLKCSRCRHIFPFQRKQRAAGPAAAPKPQTAPQQEQELSLSFDESHWEAGQRELPLRHSDGEFSLGEPESGGEYTLDDEECDPVQPEDAGGVHSASAAEPSRDLFAPEDALRHDPEAEPETGGDAPLTFEEADDEDEDVGEGDDEDDEEEEDEEEDEDDFEDSSAGEEREDEVDEESMSRRRPSLLPLFVFISVVVALYFVLARTLMGNRDLADSFVAKIPLVGSSIAADRLLFRKVALSHVEGAYVRIKDGKEVFVISGTALNTASRPLRGIQIEGSLLNSEGHELRRQVVTCGGVINQRMLQDLTLRELEILSKIEPPKRFAIAPGESTPFSIVFPDPPRDVSEFASRVTTAQR